MSLINGRHFYRYQQLINFDLDSRYSDLEAMKFEHSLSKEDMDNIYNTDMALFFVKNNKIHRDDGPAIICEDLYHYYINGENITDKVEPWLEENNMKPECWSVEEKIMFKLRFCN